MIRKINLTEKKKEKEKKDLLYTSAIPITNTSYTLFIFLCSLPPYRA